MKTSNPAQYLHLMDMLSTHLTSAKTDVEDDANHVHISGTCFSIFLNPTLNSLRCLVVDSGATTHISFTKIAFHKMQSIQNIYITLSKHERIPVFFTRYVKISYDLMLEDVLFVLSISSLTRNSSKIVRVLADS